MTKITAYNEFSIKPENSRIVCSYALDETNLTRALDKAQRTAAAWNKNEKRENMRVHFLMAGDKVRAI